MKSATKGKSRAIHSRWVEIGPRRHDTDERAARELVRVWRWALITFALIVVAWYVLAPSVLSGGLHKVPAAWLEARWYAWTYSSAEAAHRAARMWEWMSVNVEFHKALVMAVAGGVALSALLRVIVERLGR